MALIPLIHNTDQTVMQNPLKMKHEKKKKNIADEWISDNTWGQQIHTTEQRISVTNSGFN